jgi:hypothetical protein
MSYESVTHGYANRGYREILNRLGQVLAPADEVVAPYDILLPLSRKRFLAAVSPSLPLESVQRWIGTPAVQCVVLGLAYNVLLEFDAMQQDPEIPALLESSMSRERIGDYYLWIRRNRF